MANSAEGRNRFNFEGFVGGLIGSILSLLSCLYNAFWISQAFGFGANIRGVLLTVMIGFAVAGFACGVLAMLSSVRGRTAVLTVVLSIACPIFSAIGMELILA